MYKSSVGCTRGERGVQKFSGVHKRLAKDPNLHNRTKMSEWCTRVQCR